MPHTGPHRLAYPLKNIWTAPRGDSRRYDTTTAYILGDIDPDDNSHDGNGQYTIHRDKCDAAREMFQLSISCDSLVPVRYRGNRDSDWLVRYFQKEIDDRGEGDLMIVYAHVRSRGNGLGYTWDIHGNNHWINASDLAQIFINGNVDAKVICDSSKPSRYNPKWKKPEGVFEFISNGVAYCNDDGTPRRDGLTEAMRDSLRHYVEGGHTRSRFRMSMPMIMGSNQKLWAHPWRTWTNTTKQLSDEIVERLIADRDDVAAHGIIRFHKCRIQGPPVRDGSDENDEDDDLHSDGSGDTPPEDDDQNGGNANADDGGGGRDSDDGDDLIFGNEGRLLEDESDQDGSPTRIDPIPRFGGASRFQGGQAFFPAARPSGRQRAEARTGDVARRLERRSPSMGIFVDQQLRKRNLSRMRSKLTEVVDLTSDKPVEKRKRGGVVRRVLPVSGMSNTINLLEDGSQGNRYTSARRQSRDDGYSAFAPTDVKDYRVGMKYEDFDLTEDNTTGGGSGSTQGGSARDVSGLNDAKPSVGLTSLRADSPLFF